MKQVLQIKRWLANMMIVTLLLTTVLVPHVMPVGVAAVKPKFSTKKITIVEGKTKKLTVKYAKGGKLSWKVKNKNVVSLVKSGKYAKKVKGKKKGTAKVQAVIEKDKLKVLEDTKNSEGLDGAFYVCFYGNQMYLFSTKAIK